MPARPYRDLSRCVLCEHRCGADRLAGEEGVCRVTEPVVASRCLHPAPPESYTVFLAGCNFKCLNCQNWSIAHYPDNGQPVEGYVEPAFLARECVRYLESPDGRFMGADRIFFSGGEATIHLPYVEEIVAEARGLRPGVKVNFDTNGFMTEQSLQRILAFATSLTFDIKAFSDEVHRALTGAPVDPVLRNAEILARRAPERIWEFRVLVIPGISDGEVEPMCRFLAGLGRDLPVCFLAFRPNFVLESHPGPGRELMERCVEAARQAGLRRATWAGVTDVPGLAASEDPALRPFYRTVPARVAASAAAAAGCTTHPRDCYACLSSRQCPVKRYVPVRQC
ncbi:MAG: radical SAM protein [bacterium]|nr:MAG: radical SAM protein [bacterium]